MLTIIFNKVKSWQLRDPQMMISLEEFERIESKHTRVIHDVDIYEMIRVY
ncbi:hypothetical protein [Bacillus sp. B1-b2]|nr:hypothetical protein [Bacillus sp. B1-b2]